MVRFGGALCFTLLACSCAPDRSPVLASPTARGQPMTQPVAVYEIQGAAHRSPLAGRRVQTRGIVTAVGQFDAVGRDDLRGFFLQDALGDGDVATSDAVFVASIAALSVGDEVRVTGRVEETGFPGELTYTRIGSSSAPATVTVLSRGNALPAAVLLGSGGRLPPDTIIDDDAFGRIPASGNFDATTDGADYFESLEAMRVTVKDAVAVSGTSGYGEIFAVADGGAAASGLGERGALVVRPRDFNPERVQLDVGRERADPAFERLPVVNTGAKLGTITGIIGYDFGNYQLQPTAPVSVLADGLTAERTTLEPSAHQLLLASYNVLNLDVDDNDGDKRNGLRRDRDIADGRFHAIARHIVDHLSVPDIIGLQEIQDNNGTVDDGTVAADQTLQFLADTIVDVGGPRYAFIDNTLIVDGKSGGVPGGNIRTAFLYNPSRVRLVSGSVRTVDDRNAFRGARLPLIATFEFNGARLTVINNHLSSKGGSAPVMGTEQPFEALQEEPAVNGGLDARRRQSTEVRRFVAKLLDAAPATNIALLGDFNEFEFVSPVADMASVGLRNLTNSLTEHERYTFIYQGNAQALDHVLISAGLVDGAEYDIVHVNAEFADTPGRASDHDPVLARLTLGRPPR